MKISEHTEIEAVGYDGFGNETVSLRATGCLNLPHVLRRLQAVSHGDILSLSVRTADGYGLYKVYGGTRLVKII